MRENDCDGGVLSAWRTVCDVSRAGYAPLFSRLRVRVLEAGESLYAPGVGPLVADLLATGIACVDEGAVIIRFSGDGAPLQPLLLTRSDGAFLYAATDLVALRERLVGGAQRIVYVTDAAQALHFRQLFAAARAAGWILDSNMDGGKCSGRNALCPSNPLVSLEHASFGAVTGAGGKKLASRDGTEATLRGLLDAATLAARDAIDAGGGDGGEKGNESSAALLPTAARELPPAALDALAERIACSAIRFHDLSHRRESAYAHDVGRALSLKGRSSAYCVYALARLRALRGALSRTLCIDLHALVAGGRDAPTEEVPDGRGDSVARADAAAGWRASAEWTALLGMLETKVGSCAEGGADAPLIYESPQERALAVAVLSFGDATAAAARVLGPHLLADHALELAGAFHTFYANARIVPLPSDVADAGVWGRVAERVELCAAVEAVLRADLALLGVDAVDRL